MSLIGKKVIVRSNEDEPVACGILVAFDKMNESHTTKVARIQLENGKEIWSNGIIMEDNMWNRHVLSQFTRKNQHEFFSAFIRFQNDLNAERNG